MHDAVKQGFREGFNHYLPYSIGFVVWGLVTGIAMRSSGLSLTESIGMNLIVYGATAQLGTLPLITQGAPIWLIALTALVLNLRFLIFSATLAPVFQGVRLKHRWLSGYLLVDGVAAAYSSRLLAAPNTAWRYGYFLGPSLWSWACWQLATLVGELLADSIPRNWPLGFMATIALLVLLIPMCRERSMLASALVGGAMVIVLGWLPLRMGLFCAILFGMVAGYLTEQWVDRKVEHA